MSATTKIKKTQDQAEQIKKTDETVEVLYQRLGDKWYAFSIIDDEVFFGSVPKEMPNLAPDKLPQK